MAKITGENTLNMAKNPDIFREIQGKTLGLSSKKFNFLFRSVMFFDLHQSSKITVLRIRNVYPGSRNRLFSIPDPNCLHPGSASKNLSILTQKMVSKL
jgi:hypothetical protein